MRVPATQAVRKHAMDPATYALMATPLISAALSGAIWLMAAVWMPREARLLKPHKAYVDRVADRSLIWSLMSLSWL